MGGGGSSGSSGRGRTGLRPRCQRVVGGSTTVTLSVLEGDPVPTEAEEVPSQGSGRAPGVTCVPDLFTHSRTPCGLVCLLSYRDPQALVEQRNFYHFLKVGPGSYLRRDLWQGRSRYSPLETRVSGTPVHVFYRNLRPPSFLRWEVLPHSWRDLVRVLSSDPPSGLSKGPEPPGSRGRPVGDHSVPDSVAGGGRVSGAVLDVGTRGVVGPGRVASRPNLERERSLSLEGGRRKGPRWPGSSSSGRSTSHPHTLSVRTLGPFNDGTGDRRAPCRKWKHAGLGDTTPRLGGGVRADEEARTGKGDGRTLGGR